MDKKNSLNKEILSLAIPNIVSNITIPLLSLVDTAVAGHLSDISSLGAIAVASALVNTIYWLWGFLRMGTTGLVAQAYGKNDKKEISRYLFTGILIAVVCGLIIIIARPLLYQCSFLISDHNTSIDYKTVDYLRIIFIGAPAALLLYVLNGWFIGMQNTRIPLYVAILTNIINIISSVFFALFLNMGIRGLAYGTILAQWIGVVISLLFIFIKYPQHIIEHFSPEIFTKHIFIRYIVIGKDLIIRTIMMSGITLFFTRMGSSYGTNVVSANMLLMLLFTIFSYFMDGFAYSAEALTGKYIGKNDYKRLKLVIKRLFCFGIYISIISSLVYLLFSEQIISLLSDKQNVILEALKYKYYVALIPITSFSAFILDGVFVGATASRSMLITIFFATCAFFLLYFGGSLFLSTEVLWVSFIGYLTTRSGYQLLISQKVIHRQFNHNI